MTDDLKMYTAHVQCNANHRMVETLEIENFPATSVGNAHSYAVRAGMEHLKNQGYCTPGVITGVQVMAVEEYGTKPAKALPVQSAAAAASKATYKNTAPAVVYKPFSCPITSLCKVKYSGVRRDTSFLLEEK